MKMMLKTIVMGLVMSLLFGLSLAQAQRTVLKDEVISIKVTVRGGALTCVKNESGIETARIKLEDPDLYDTMLRHEFSENNRFTKEDLCTSIAEIIDSADPEGKVVVQKRVYLSFVEVTRAETFYPGKYLYEGVTLTLPNNVKFFSHRHIHKQW